MKSITDSVLDSNTAPYGGVAAAIQGASLVMENNYVINNEASIAGGVIFSPIVFTEDSFSSYQNNSAVSYIIPKTDSLVFDL